MPVASANEYSFAQLVEILRCPSCRGELRFEPVDQGLPDAHEYGVLRCSCNQYPVVDGICIVMNGTVGAFEHTEGHVEYKGPTAEELTQLVLSGRGLDALLRCIVFPPTIKRLDRIPVVRSLWQSKPVREWALALRRSKLREWCTVRRSSLSAEDWLDLFYRQYSPVKGDLFSYFFCRFAQPRHLATMALTECLPSEKKPLIDLACGFGHLGYNLAESPGTHPVVGVDRNFFQLWVAQHWIAAKNRFVCLDADQPFPFADGSLGGTLCCDAFHYFRQKNRVLAEIERCAPGQPVLLTGVGNKMVEPTEGFELTPSEYLHLLDDSAWRAFGETELVNLYLRREPVDLLGERAAELVNTEKWLYLVHPGKPPAMTRPQDQSAWPHAAGRLDINPIYQVSQGDDKTWRLEFRFPSEHYALENASMKTLYPQTVTVSDETYKQIGANIRSAEVKRLIEQMVVIGLSDHYVRRG